MSRRQPLRPRPPPRSPAQQLVVAGRGNLGRSLAAALSAAGHLVLLTPARNGIPKLARYAASHPASLVFLTVPDSALPDLSQRIGAADRAIPATVAFAHSSGALGLDSLAATARRHPVGSFHPLQSFPEPRPPESFKGITVAVDASRIALRRRLEGLARDLGAKPRHVEDSQRALYHAAAVFASNYVVALIDTAVELLGELGWSKQEAAAGLMPLVAGAVAAVTKRGPTAALTGPIRRGDVPSVKRHLDALLALDERPSQLQLADVYRMLGQITLEVAKEAGLEPVAAEQMSRALTRNVAATRRRRRS